MTTPDDDADSLFLTDGSLRPELLGEGVLAVLQEAVRKAGETNWDLVHTFHLFMGLMAVPDASVSSWGKHVQLDLPKLLGQFQDLFYQEESKQDPIPGFRRPFLSDEVVQLLAAGRARATLQGRTSLTPLDLLIAIFTKKTIVAECFERVGVSAGQLVDLATLAERETGKQE
jgi:ATP-dependent Clp protease ATP-binding subunit ClpA